MIHYAPSHKMIFCDYICVTWLLTQRFKLLSFYIYFSKQQYTRSTQPCIPLELLHQVPASAGVRVRMSPLQGGR